jgi:methylated-DNA-[protein]-cysteine S-methyltransferase
MPTLIEQRVTSPFGPLRLFADDTHLVGVHFEGRPAPSGGVRRNSHVIDQAAAELAEYFAGKRREFHTPLRFAGTAFQREVWRALCVIPYGVTRSYGELAQLLARPAASRAVGAANGQNPISIFVPCHRLVGSTGKLTGYGGGLAFKQWLLELEGVPRRIRC